MAWDYPTNFSDGQNVSSIAGLLTYSNYVTNGTLGIGLLIVIFMMSFLGGAMLNVRKSLLSASFITFIFSMYFMRLQLISVGVVMVIIIAFIVFLILGAKEGGSYS